MLPLINGDTIIMAESITQPLGPAEVQRLKDIIFEGVSTKTEIESLQEGMSDMIKSVSEELNIPAKLLKKAITLAHKGTYKDAEDELADLDKILTAVDKK